MIHCSDGFRYVFILFSLGDTYRYARFYSVDVYESVAVLNIYNLIFADDEISLLVIVVDVNPIWWGQQAQRESEVGPSSLILRN